VLVVKKKVLLLCLIMCVLVMCCHVLATTCSVVMYGNVSMCVDDGVLVVLCVDEADDLLAVRCQQCVGNVFAR
jgi:hypothetical protein